MDEKNIGWNSFFVKAFFLLLVISNQLPDDGIIMTPTTGKSPLKEHISFIIIIIMYLAYSIIIYKLYIYLKKI